MPGVQTMGRPAQERLTDAQVERILVVTEAMAAKGNFVAVAVHEALQNGQDPREMFAVAYGQMYELMLALQMAMDSKVRPAEVKTALARVAAHA